MNLVGPILGFTELNAGRLACGGIGQQLLTAGQTSWASTVTTNPSIFLNTQTLLNIWALLPTQNVGANVLNGIPAAASWQNPDVFWLQEAELRTSWVNVSNFAVELTAYYFKPRMDIPNIAAYASPALMFSNTLLAQGTSMTTTMLATTPFMNHGWCSLFKCYKSKKEVIDAGDSRFFNITFKKGQRIDVNKLGVKSGLEGAVTFSLHSTMKRGLSKFIMYRIQGTVGNDSVLKDTDHVTTGLATLDYRTEFRYKVRSISMTNPRNVIMSGTGFGASAGFTAFNTMLEATDAGGVAAYA